MFAHLQRSGGRVSGGRAIFPSLSTHRASGCSNRRLKWRRSDNSCRNRRFRDEGRRPRELVPLSAADRPQGSPGGALLPRSRAPRAAVRALPPQMLPAFDSVDSGAPARTFSRRPWALRRRRGTVKRTASHVQRCQRAGTAPAPREVSPPCCVLPRLSARGSSTCGNVVVDPPGTRRRRLDKRRAVPAPSGDVSTRTSWSCRVSTCCSCAERCVLHS